MDIFQFRNNLVQNYSEYVNSFLVIKDQLIQTHVQQNLRDGMLWPDPLIQLNPAFAPGSYIDDLVNSQKLHPECSQIFRSKKSPDSTGKPLRLFTHQEDAITAAKKGENYVLTSGTGSGKSLTYIIPIVDYILQNGSGKGIKAIIVYPMNALANSQENELNKFLKYGYPDGASPVRYAKYTGQESDEERDKILAEPPDILLTNYVMLELILTRYYERRMIEAAQNLRFLVFDELHTYRGRQGVDVSILIRRTKNILKADELQCIGTSATISTSTNVFEEVRQIAQVASSIFGSKVNEENIIRETLTRITIEHDFSSNAIVDKLRSRLTNKDYIVPSTFVNFQNDLLAGWIESKIGVISEELTGTLRRAKPLAITGELGLASCLSSLTGVDVNICEQRILEILLAGYSCEVNPITGNSAFAFKLHQFISKGDTVYASLEPEEKRTITLMGQKYAPGNEERKALYPLAFCRECGQEYYVVTGIGDNGLKSLEPRELNEVMPSYDRKPGFLFRNSKNPWPDNGEEILQRIPEEWKEIRNGRLEIKKNRRENLPRLFQIDTLGNITSDGLDYHFLSAPFRFCLSCGVSYGFRDRSDFGKLSSLSSEGRSTATTILSLKTIQLLRNENSIPKDAKKLLSFTDNRQDASLQAGHFNDFIEISLIRSALHRAVVKSGNRGLSHDELAIEVFKALNIQPRAYALRPEAKYADRQETERAFREILSYRLYRDLKRGWRVTSPNLEQSGLLEIRYPSLDEVSEDDELWRDAHPALSSASSAVRKKICKVLMDFLRRELAIKINCLDSRYQEQLRSKSEQYLVQPWAIDEKEVLEFAKIVLPRASETDDDRSFLYLSRYSAYSQYLRRSSTFPSYSIAITTEESETIINDILLALKTGGMVEEIQIYGSGEIGYQVPASAFIWYYDSSTVAFHDPIRVPNLPEAGRRANPYFVLYYKNDGLNTREMEAREHTAQVGNEERKMREKEFGSGILPVLYCSPTMELGVDISSLNIVNLRNIPPTPANYAQRSGRAGRSGQPAMIYSYCSTGSSHDQYFFKRPELMVAGSVTPPRLDLANEDLVRSHIHAVWLSESGLSLGRSLKDILDVDGAKPSLNLLPSVQKVLNDENIKKRALARARVVLKSFEADLQKSDWYSEKWVEEILDHLPLSFEQSCERWKTLYTSALAQAEAQDFVIRDASRQHKEKQEAERLRREAEAQLRLLAEIQNVAYSDFYSYRYFASEGFLPGYSFPRLPLSAYIPQRRKSIKDEFLSRPRFLAISEFGPRAIIYHEGSKYVINKVIMPVVDDEVLTTSIKLCHECGYLHVENDDIHNTCQNCEAPLGNAMDKLFRLQNVVTRRRERINSDEEERVRMGYELLTAVRYNEQSGRALKRVAEVSYHGSTIAKLEYGHAATIWRINLGWRRRNNPNQYGFMLDKERGYWAKNDMDPDDESDPLSQSIQRVVPFVEDRKNALIFKPLTGLQNDQMASLQAALKSAIQIEFQLEDNELAAEPLPKSNDRKLILFYEAAEGGAGVLRQLIDDPECIKRIASRALEICHFDPLLGDDLHRAPHSRYDCIAACYDCLMSYSNQTDHDILDRHQIKNYLQQLQYAEVFSSSTETSRAIHLENLISVAESSLEKKWLLFLEENNLRLPSRSQVYFDKCNTRPDFIYENHQAVVYVDGPSHDFPEREKRDNLQEDCMNNYGWEVIRFKHTNDWFEIINRYPNIFGSLK